MDFFSLSRSDFSSPVGQAIDKGSSEVLIGPDWALNIEICDMINSSYDSAQNAIKAFRRKLKSENPKVIQLTLTMIETAVKNCNASFHSMVGSRDFLPEVTALIDGEKSWEVREQALSLIQQWGLAFQAKQDTMPFFYEAYMKLRLKGVQFPPIESSAPIFTPPAHASSSATTPSSARATASSSPMDASTPRSLDNSAQTEAELAKLKRDLQNVSERVRLCQEMLPNSPGISQDDALAEIIGFLEACKPRMVDVVEAGIQGLLNEDLLELALKVNDDLLRTLEAERTRKALPVEVKEGEQKGERGATEDLLDFGDMKPSARPLPPKDSIDLASLIDTGDETGPGLSAQRGGERKSTPSPAPTITSQTPPLPPSSTSTNPFDVYAGSSSTNQVPTPSSTSSYGQQGATPTTIPSATDLLFQDLKIDSSSSQPIPSPSSTSTANTAAGGGSGNQEEGGGEGKEGSSSTAAAGVTAHDDFDHFLNTLGSPKGN